MRKKLLPVLLSMVLVVALLPATAFAADDTVENIRTFCFDGGATTQDSIDKAFGEGVVSYTSEEVEGETIYTIKLLKNINMAQGQDIRIGKYKEDGLELPQMILDLNGHTITSSSIGLINYADLIIRDTSDSQTGGITYSTTSDKSSLVAVSNYASLLIESGIFTCDSGYSFTGYVAAISTDANAATYIKGGKFVSDSSAVISSGETVVYGGLFEAKYGMYAKSAAGKPGTITIPEDSTAVVNASDFALVIQRDDETDGKISAAGGIYNAPNVVGGVKSPDTAEAVDITGGIFKVSPKNFVPNDTAVAALTAAGQQDAIAYAVGSDITEVVSAAGTGDKIDVLQGNINFDTIADGVVVVNSGDGDVSVNGEPVNENPVTVCNHEWENPTWTWTDTTSAEATFTCAKNEAHTAKESAQITSEVTKKPTCTSMGEIVYTAKVTFWEKEYTDIKRAADVPMTSHTLVKIEANAPTTETTGNIEYWKCNVCGGCFADADGRTAITDDEIAISKIPAIIKGANGIWQKGGKEGLSFTSNADFAEFVKVQVDGKDLNKANYEIKEGSTVVTLKASYLETLPAGAHLVSIVSDTGIASTKFTIKADGAGEETNQTGGTDKEDDKIPQTGESDNMMLWVTLLVISLGGTISTMYLGKRKAYKR